MGRVRTKKVDTNINIADVLTKSTPSRVLKIMKKEIEKLKWSN